MYKLTEKNSLDFLQRVIFSIDQTGDHWVWKGATRKDGYGTISFLAHRLVYELLVGRIPNGLVIDHTCRKRDCVNPAHLRVVTIAQNNECGDSPAAKNARKKSCIHGHKFTPENTAWHKKAGHLARICRKCVQRMNRASNAKNIKIHCVFCGREKEANRIKKARYCLACAERRNREGVAAYMRRRRASVHLSKAVA